MHAVAMSPISHKTGRFVDGSARDTDRTYALFNHLIGLLSMADAGSGLLGLLGAALMWRIKASENGFLDDHGREAVNFQLSLLVYVIAGVIGGVLFSIATLGIGAVVFGLAPLFGVALLVLRLVGTIRGAVAASRGEYYRYPMCIRFFKARHEKFPTYACRQCGYDLRGTSGPTCPECGTARA